MKTKITETLYFDDIECEKFKEWLFANQLTQQQFADICGISLTYLNLIINGKRAITDKIKQTFEKGDYSL